MGRFRHDPRSVNRPGRAACAKAKRLPRYVTTQTAKYIVFGDKGHGFTNRANNIKANQAII
jgi:hypothetical protein